jgi:xylulokinase
MSLLGLDIGITGCKAVAFSLMGEMLAQAYREYPLYQPKPGWMELDPAEVWGSVKTVISEVTLAIPDDPVRALSIATHGESVVPIGVDGRPLTRFITALDTRAVEETRWWDEQVGKERIFRITGMPLHPMYTANKLMWLRKHAPETFRGARRFLCMPDFLYYQLGVPPAMDYSLARTMVFDVNRLPGPMRCWSWRNWMPGAFRHGAINTVLGEIDPLWHRSSVWSGCGGGGWRARSPNGSVGCGRSEGP